MARISLAPFLQDASGTIGNIIAGKNRGSIYIKDVSGKNAKKRKVNAQYGSTTQWPAKQQQQSDFGDVVRGWSALTQSNRNEWENLANQYNNTRVIRGIILKVFPPGGKKLTGYNLYLYSNLNLKKYEDYTINTPPVDLSIPTFHNINFSIDSGLGTFYVTPNQNLIPVDNALLIYWSNQIGAGNQIRQNKLIYYTSYYNGAPSVVDIFADYIARFGALVSGKKIGLGWRLMNMNSGFKAPFQMAAEIVV